VNIGIIGLGKVGLTLALLFAEKGHQVYGHDIDLDAVSRRLDDVTDRGEHGLGALIASTGSRLVLCSYVEDFIRDVDVIFVAVQTPHEPGYGGERPTSKLPPRDFDYSHLENALSSLRTAAHVNRVRPTVGVISTVTIGTHKTRLLPLVGDQLRLVYCPVFISLGSIIQNLRDPGFMLIGVTSDESYEMPVRQALSSINDAPYQVMTIESAELFKVAYNCWLSMRIVFANEMARFCDATDADVDEVMNGFTLATHPRVLYAGLGDGGACRPRDAIAMIEVGERLGASTDVFTFVNVQRESHAEWLAQVVRTWATRTGLGIFVLGRAYKPNVPYMWGSPVMLVTSYLRDFTIWDPYDGGTVTEMMPTTPHVFLLGTNHSEFRDLRLPTGSVLVDPWGVASRQDGVTLVRPGRK